MIQSRSSKKHSQQAIIAACQGRSSLNARQRLCAESDCRTSMTSPKQFLQAHSFCLSWWQCSTASKGLPRMHLCCVPGLSPTCSHCSSLLEQPKAAGAAFEHNSFPRKAVLCLLACLLTPTLACLAPPWLDPGICFPFGSPCLFLQLWPTSLSWCSWSQFYCATFQSSWAICFHSPTFFSLSVFILLTPVPHSLHMAGPSF